MDIQSILTPERTYCSLTAASKKKAIEEAAQRIAESGLNLSAQQIYDGLINREKLGTTAIGKGVAIPHCRVDGCQSIVGSLFRLEEPIDFDSFDDEPVRILFVLLVPEHEVEDHLKALRLLAERFESDEYRGRLLTASDDRGLFDEAIAVLTHSDEAPES